MAIKESSYFYTCNGVVLKNKEDMLNFIKTADDDVLHTHMNEDKNDFANWTKDILKQKRLAKKLTNAKTKGEMVLAIEKTLKTHKKQKRDKKSVIAQLVDAIKHG